MPVDEWQEAPSPGLGGRDKKDSLALSVRVPVRQELLRINQFLIREHSFLICSNLVFLDLAEKNHIIEKHIKKFIKKECHGSKTN